MKTSQQESLSTKDHSHEIAQVFSNISQLLSRFQQETNEIASAITQQSAPAQQVSENIIDISDKAEESVQQIQHVNRSINNTARQTEKLNSQIAQFTI